jgi:hypothetical protein
MKLIFLVVKYDLESFIVILDLLDKSRKTRYFTVYNVYIKMYNVHLKIILWICTQIKGTQEWDFFGFDLKFCTISLLVMQK